MQSKEKLEKNSWSTEDGKLGRRRDWMDSLKVGMRSCGVFGSGSQNWRSGNSKLER